MSSMRSQETISFSLHFQLQSGSLALIEAVILYAALLILTEVASALG